MIEWDGPPMGQQLAKTELGTVSIPSELLAPKEDVEVIVACINENVLSVFGGEQAH